MVDITERIPFSLARAAVDSAFTGSGITPDITIGNLPFFLATADDRPYDRKTADFRRQQIDTSKEPGEQTLSQWWVRDQDSWHRGAGINFYEPGSDAKTQYRFGSSYGVDVWTQGQASLLRKMVQDTAASGNCYATGAVVSGADVVFFNTGSTIRRWNGTTTTNYTGGSPTTEPVVAGAKVIAGSTAGIHVGDLTGSTLSTTWTTSGSVLRPWWAKSRIIAAQDNKLYDLALTGSGALPAALYTHPSTGFVWTAVADAPGGILAAGNAGGYGYIYKFTLTEGASGGTPTLGSGTQVAEFPPGEEVYSLRVYLSSYLAIGTTKGVRVGLVDDSANVAYGPVVVATTKPVRALSARDTYIYAGIEADVNGNSGCARIDLSEAISDLRFPWAYDVQVPFSDAVQSVTFFGTTDRVVLGVSGQGVWRQSDTVYEDSGVLTSGWIRYATSEPKLFNRAKVRATVSGEATVTLSTIDAGGSEQTIITLGSTFNTDSDITLRSVEDSPQSNIKIVLTLMAGDTGTTTPVVQSYQVKATPVPAIQRELAIPLSLFDHEKDRQGIPIGYDDSFAYDRLVLLEDMESSRSVVVVKDWTSGESFSAQIQGVRLIRTTPPARNKRNFGGYLYVTLLKL